MRARRQPNDKHPRQRIAKGRHRSPPILPVTPLPAFHAGNFGAVLAQPWTTLTGYDSLIQSIQIERIQAPGLLQSIPRFLLHSNSVAATSAAVTLALFPSLSELG